MTVLGFILLIVISFSSGIVISGGVFAAITAVGIIPRMARRTNTEKYSRVYEAAVVMGGIFGGTTMFINYSIPVGAMGSIVVSALTGIFVGVLAMSLAEVFDVIPVVARRMNLPRATTAIVLAIAFGKLMGSFVYYFVPGFFTK